MTERASHVIILLLLPWNLVLSSDEQKIESAFSEINEQLATCKLGEAFSSDVILKALKSHNYDVDEAMETLLTSLGSKNNNINKAENNDLEHQQHPTTQNLTFPNECTHKEKTEEQLEFENAGNQSKNFVVGETILIDGLTTGPVNEPLPNGKLAEIQNGPIYRRNKKTQIVQEKYEISIENNTKLPIPSDFLHKISREDIEKIWRERLHTYFEQSGLDSTFVVDLVEKVKLRYYPSYEAAQTDLHRNLMSSSSSFKQLQKQRSLKIIAQDKLGKQFGYDEIMDALETNDCNVEKALGYLREKLENKNTISRISRASEDSYEPEIWRQRLIGDFEPLLRNLGWNDADLKSLIGSFDFNAYSSYEDVKIGFADLFKEIASDERLQLAFDAISQHVGDQFSSYPIRKTIVAVNYDVDKAIETLYSMKENNRRYQMQSATQPTKQNNNDGQFDIGEKLRPQRVLSINDEAQTNVLNPPSRNQNNDACLQKVGHGTDFPFEDYSQVIHSRIPGIERLLLGAETGNAAVVAEMVLEQDVPMNSINMFGDTALHLAALNGHDECIALLLNINADLFALNNAEQSVLCNYIKAIYYNIGSISGMRNLLEHGARPTLQCLQFLEAAAEMEDATGLVKEAAKYLKQFVLQNNKI